MPLAAEPLAIFAFPEFLAFTATALVGFLVREVSGDTFHRFPVTGSPASGSGLLKSLWIASSSV
jgi:hypothetical protein